MKKYILVMAGLMSITMVSCEKFLEEKPYDFIGSANFYKTEGDANAALNGVFSSLQPQTYFGRTSWLVTELSGDLMRVNATLADRDNLYGQTFDANNGEIGNWWNSSFNLINRANDVIKNVPNISMDVTRRNNIVGNARFLRAMAYFDLVRSFGSVPLILNPTEDLSNLKPARTPIAEIYTQIIEDLQFAETNCTAENLIPASAKGRVSTGAASALLAKVYLTKATTTAKEATDYTNSLTASNKVINSGLYALGAYADVFDVTKENNRDHIFSIQFDLPPNVGNIVVRMHLPAGLNGTGSFVVEKSFEDSFLALDTRKALTLKKETTTSTNAYYSKFADPLRQTNNARNNVLITRYADVLLLQSEALNEINAADATKLTGINAVRTRAGLPILLLTNVLTRDAFVDALVQERAWEFSAEGHRRFDLLRLGRYKQRQLAAFNRTVADKYLLFPIPQTEIDLNPNLKPQNPGFE
ncbi:RagB/SusD family nutrient uptake outer membrane protein [Pedobacter cryophilus]|uniref:RagB/SusD family nutrient uptake outer membrane protein n=1 Tax=Pedobacter cryophilus TaxID=2571271 RepID=A0A4U1BTP9_9SPHI|nr:RagB/SusD family nutrient uptake outer membrane protein [Pedobacter cryophilus]TKB95945.1 RagB/SusD family nutrient uptake outer membrane protein [Pedobacter cryophilus]